MHIFINVISMKYVFDNHFISLKQGKLTFHSFVEYFICISALSFQQ